MKKILTCIMLTVISVSVWSCGGDEPRNENNPTEPTPDIKPTDPELRPFIGTWLAEDGEGEEIQVSFFANGKYTDAIMRDGKLYEEFAGTFTLDNDIVNVPSKSNISNAWGNEYNVEHISATKMRWSNSLMTKFDTEWVLTKTSSAPSGNEDDKNGDEGNKSDGDGNGTVTTESSTLGENRKLTLTGTISPTSGVVEAGFELCDNKDFKDPVKITYKNVSGMYQSVIHGILDDFTYYYRSYAVINGQIKYGQTKSFTTPQLTYSIGNKTFKMVKVEGGPVGDFSIMQTEYPDAYDPGIEICGVHLSYISTECGRRCVTKGIMRELLSRLSAITGLLFRYPTLEEWMYAAKGGKYSKGYLYSGGDDVNEVAWYNGNCQNGRNEALLKANELGLYDMSGNYAEIAVKSTAYDDFLARMEGTSIKDVSAAFFNLTWAESNLKVCGGNWSSNASDCELYKFRPASDLNLKISEYKFVMDRATFRLVYLRDYKNCKVLE